MAVVIPEGPHVVVTVTPPRDPSVQEQAVTVRIPPKQAVDRYMSSRSSLPTGEE